MSAKVYVVMGTTGEYSDRKEWPVAAFTAEEGAAGLLTQLETWCREHGCHVTVRGRSHRLSDVVVADICRKWDEQEEAAREAADWDDAKTNFGNPLDPAMKYVYTGVDYWVMPVDLR